MTGGRRAQGLFDAKLSISLTPIFSGGRIHSGPGSRFELTTVTFRFLWSSYTERKLKPTERRSIVELHSQRSQVSTTSART
jgi:hypothetical protein